MNYIYGNYYVERVYKSSGQFPVEEVKTEIDATHNYFGGTEETYAFFRENFPEYNITITPCTGRGSKPPHKPKNYIDFHVKRLKVTFNHTHNNNYAIFILGKG